MDTYLPFLFRFLTLLLLKNYKMHKHQGVSININDSFLENFYKYIFYINSQSAYFINII